MLQHHYWSGALRICQALFLGQSLLDPQVLDPQDQLFGAHSHLETRNVCCTFALGATSQGQKSNPELLWGMSFPQSYTDLTETVQPLWIKNSILFKT